MKAKQIFLRQQSVSSLGVAAVALFASTGAHGAAITWGTATTIAANTDVITTGALKYAYTESNGSATVNGVVFSAGSSAYSLGGGNVTMTGFTSVNNTTFSSPSGVTAALLRGAPSQAQTTR